MRSLTRTPTELDSVRARKELRERVSEAELLLTCRASQASTPATLDRLLASLIPITDRTLSLSLTRPAQQQQQQ